MDTNKITETNRKAWEENWHDIDIRQIMEIFTYPRVKKQLELYGKYLNKDGKILEGGCGLGPYLIYLRSLGYDVVGIDYNHEPLTKIVKYDRGMPVYCSDITRVPFKNSFFSAYLSLGVIEHFIEGPIAAIKEAWRIIKPEGYFIVQVPRFSIFNMITYPLDLLRENNTLRKIFRRKIRTRYWQQHFKISDLRRLLDNNGFDVIEIVPIDHEHALIAFSDIFRNKKLYDGANRLGLFLSDICQRYMPWSTAAEMVFICKRRN